MSRMRRVLAAQFPWGNCCGRLFALGPHLVGSEFRWAIAFFVPYAAVFLAFAFYPIGYGLWMGRDPALYLELLQDPNYTRSLINTLLYVGVGVNITLFLGLLLSG